MQCVFYKNDKCLIFERRTRIRETNQYHRDEKHIAKYCDRGKFLKCPVYLHERANPVISCPCTGRCRHHSYYPHYLCVAKIGKAGKKYNRGRMPRRTVPMP